LAAPATAGTNAHPGLAKPCSWCTQGVAQLDAGGRGGLVRRSASGAARPPAARLSAPDVRKHTRPVGCSTAGTERCAPS
jgi:hypothetical protein